MFILAVVAISIYVFIMRKREKIECTIHSKKAIHGNKVYLRLPSARANEETLRWINHNINVLNRARIEWNIIPKFMD